MPLLFFFIAPCPIKDGPRGPQLMLKGGENTTAAAMTHPSLMYDLFSSVRLKKHWDPWLKWYNNIKKNWDWFICISAHTVRGFKHFHLMLSITLFIPQFQALKY